MDLLSTTATSLAGLNSFPTLQMWKPTGSKMFEPSTSFEKFVDIESLTRCHFIISAFAPKMKLFSRRKSFAPKQEAVTLFTSVFMQAGFPSPPFSTISDRVRVQLKVTACKTPGCGAGNIRLAPTGDGQRASAQA